MIEIVKQEVFKGPSIWCPRPVVHVLLNATDSTFDQSSLARFHALRSRLSSNEKASDSSALPNQSTQDVNSVAHALAVLMLVAQQQASWDVRHAGAIPSITPGMYDVYCEHGDETAALAALSFSVQALNNIFHEPEITSITSVPDPESVPPATPIEVIRFILEARNRGIPVRQSTQNPTLVEFGNGRLQRRYWGLTTSRTSRIGERIAANKSLTSQLLRQRGLPVPPNILVQTIDEAVGAAATIEYPVVLKPVASNLARGVFIDLRDESELRQRFADSQKMSRSGGVVVEKYLQGPCYRILVIDNKVAAVRESVATHVIGDGVRSIQELIDIANTEPRRNTGQARLVMRKITVDEETEVLLAREGLTLSDVPSKDQIVWLHRIPTLGSGGFSYDRTADIHPDNAAIACQAAMVIGLDFAGLDVVAPDISRSIWETGGGIAEVNSGPGYSLHSRPVEGGSMNVEGIVLDMLYPPGQPVRVPVIALAGSSDPTPTARLIAHLLSSAGRTVGLSTPKGIVIAGMPFSSLHPDAHHPAQVALLNPTIDIAVLALAPSDLDHPGLPFDCIDIAVITSSFDFTPQNGLHNIDTILARIVTPGGATIVPADDALYSNLASETVGNVILVSENAAHIAVRRHVDSGGKAIVLASINDASSVMLISPMGQLQILDSRDLRALHQANPHQDLPGMLYAIAVAIASNVSASTIRNALQSAQRTTSSS